MADELPDGFELDSPAPQAQQGGELPEGFEVDQPAAANPHEGYTRRPGAPLPGQSTYKWPALSSMAGAAARGAVKSVTTDVAGAPMDFATNVWNLGKSAVEDTELAMGHLPPKGMDPVDPEKVPGTSAWINKKVKGTSFGDITNLSPTETDPGLQLAYGAGEIAGPFAGKKLGQGAVRALATGVEGMPQGMQKAVTALGGAAKGAAATDPQDIVNAQAGSAQTSMGARTSAPDLSKVSDPIKKAVSDGARKNGGAVNMDAVNAHADADTLPVPIKLSRGQALDDRGAVAEEWNRRGELPGALDFYRNQSKGLGDNLDAIRDKAAEGLQGEVGNPEAHGNRLIQAYQDMDNAKRTQISQKYQALRDANGGDFPVDATQLHENVVSALQKQMLLEHSQSNKVAPVLKQLESAGDSGSMNFEQYEAMRTNLARIQRDGDGTEAAAAGLIRQKMEDLPLTGEARNLKPLADSARAAASERFKTIEADPAYKAAIGYDRDSPGIDKLPGQFVRKYVTGATSDQTRVMRQNLDHDPQASATLKVAALDDLKAKAMPSGNFRQSSYNKAWSAIPTEKKRMLFEPDEEENLDKLGRVSQRIQGREDMDLHNYSNTTSSAAAMAARGVAGKLVELGKTGLEHTANVKGMMTTGIPGLGTATRHGVGMFMDRKSAAKYAQKAFAPGAGIDELPATK